MSCAAGSRARQRARAFLLVHRKRVLHDELDSDIVRLGEGPAQHSHTHVIDDAVVADLARPEASDHLSVNVAFWRSSLRCDRQLQSVLEGLREDARSNVVPIGFCRVDLVGLEDRRRVSSEVFNCQYWSECGASRSYGFRVSSHHQQGGGTPPWIRKYHPSFLVRALVVVVMLVVQVVEHHASAVESSAAMVAFEWQYDSGHATVIDVVSSASIVSLIIGWSLGP